LRGLARLLRVEASGAALIRSQPQTDRSLTHLTGFAWLASRSQQSDLPNSRGSPTMIAARLTGQMV
jgi:hypothetical protein